MKRRLESGGGGEPRPMKRSREASPPGQQARGKYSYSNVGGESRGRVPSYLEDEEDEDSELEGFIDDTPIDDGFGDKEIQRTIKEVFRYDKSRYAGEKWSRDDDRSMTASYKDIQKEERQSAKAGAMEDHQEFLREKSKKAKNGKK